MQATSKRAPRWQWAVFISMAVLLPIVMFATWRDSTAGYGPPAILKASDSDVQRNPNINSRLTAALNARFPQDSDVARMKAALLAEGFHADPARAGELDYRWDETACDHLVVVLWNADARGRLTGIMGRYRDVCL